MFLAWLLAGICILIWLYGCGKDPTVYDPDGLREDPKRTVSMSIGRVSKND